MVETPHEGRRYVPVELEPLTDAERDALTDTRDGLEAMLFPGNRAVLIALLARLANHRPKERSAAEWRMLFEDYAEDLAPFSDAHVSEAIREHRQSNNWFPTINELRTRCLELVQRDQFRLERCLKLLRVPA